MRSVALIGLLSFIAHAHAEEVSDVLVDKLADKLVDRVEASFLRNADLETTTLGKPGNLGISLLTDPQISYGQEQEEDDRTVANYDNEQKAMLDWVLSLRGGAKAPKAMKGMNVYFTKLSEARKSGAKSFEYNGKTYVQTQ